MQDGFLPNQLSMVFKRSFGHPSQRLYVALNELRRVLPRWSYPTYGQMTFPELFAFPEVPTQVSRRDTLAPATLGGADYSSRLTRLAVFRAAQLR